MLALFLTLVQFSSVFKFSGMFLSFNFQKTLVTYWPLTTLRILLNPMVIFSDPGFYQYTFIFSKFPYVYLVTHLVVIVLTVLVAVAKNRSVLIWGLLSVVFPWVTPLVLVFLNPKPAVSQGAIYVCANCGHHREKGAPYRFHYGNLLSARSGIDFPFFATRKTYRIVGTDSAWICQICLIQRVFSALIFPILLLPGLYFGLDFEAEGFLGISLKLLGFAGLAGFILLLIGLESAGVFGDRLAIKTQKSKLEQKGFDSFFDHKHYKRLTKST
jgi:hypothetical protein